MAYLAFPVVMVGKALATRGRLEWLLPEGLIFCYLFSFYIGGIVTSAMLAGVMAMAYLVWKGRGGEMMALFTAPYYRGIVIFLLVLLSVAATFTIFTGAYDFSYCRILVGQGVQLVMGIAIILFLTWRGQEISVSKVADMILFALGLQTLWQLFSFTFPSLATLSLMANQGGEAYLSSGGTRALALSSSPYWNLPLMYAMGYLLWGWLFQYRRSDYLFYCYLPLLVVGSVFAGRFAFMGMLLMVPFLFRGGRWRWKIVGTVAGCICLMALPVIFSSSVREKVEREIIPWLASPFSHDKESTEFTSLKMLQMQWEQPFDEDDLLYGTGEWEIEGSRDFAAGTDPGILRNLYYWGVAGYTLLLLYQCYLLYPVWREEKTRLLAITLTLLLLLAEIKAATLGINKSPFTLLLLLSFPLSHSKMTTT